MERTVVLSSYLRCVSHLLTGLRDSRTGKVKFTRYADRLMSILCEEGLSHLPHLTISSEITTPTQMTVPGVELDVSSIVAISIIRAGDSMLDCFLRIVPEASVGKILIQRDEETAKPVFLYSKLPDLTNKTVILLDPMLATGGSANEAIRLLLTRGAVEENIAFFSVVSCPEGIANVSLKYPNVKLITAEVDSGLNERSYIVPGLGDYGDRYFGTV